MRILLSVCTARDLDVWGASHLKIIEHVKSDRYAVIVPAKDVEVFRKNTHESIEVINEDSVGKGLRSALDSGMGENPRDRFGWYYQQFLKLAFLFENLSFDEFVIWDADTLPVRDIHFFKGETVFYYQSCEYHLPYFEQIKKSLELDKCGNFSFISQNIALKGVWARSYFSYLESMALKKGHHSWFAYLISTIDFREKSGFSEYESLGTFIKNHKPDLFLPNKRKWFRYGSDFFCIKNLRGIVFSLMVRRFDYIAFESWRIKRSRLSRIFLFIRVMVVAKNN